MPNHCFNKISISEGNADGQSLQVLVESLKSEENQTDFDFNAILPMPPELENVGWSEAEEMNDTAWGPPTGVIEALREQCPDFSISAFYDEPGMEMAGYY